MSAIGAFYSGTSASRARCRRATARHSVRQFNQPAGTCHGPVEGLGSKQRIKGTTSVSKAQMKMYGGSNPVRMIKACVRAT